MIAKGIILRGDLGSLGVERCNINFFYTFERRRELREKK